MDVFFPHEFKSSKYQNMFDALSGQERGLLYQEFLGVALRRRFKPKSLLGGLAKTERRLRLSSAVWSQERTVVRHYLRLVVRHYIFGITVMLIKRHFGLQLPPPSPGCIRDSAALVVALLFLNRQHAALDFHVGIAAEQLHREKTGSFFIMALLGFLLARTLFDTAKVGNAIEHLQSQMIPGDTPLGAEMEFSNLGHLAPAGSRWQGLVCWKSCRSDEKFHNMRLYYDFHLDHVCWRLGGYLDHHVRWRKYVALPFIRIGGFFEYSLVRLDYARKRTLPFTTDTGLLATAIEALVEFSGDLLPFSLHVNIEKKGTASLIPSLDDLKILFLLGGDFQIGENGRLMEQRMGRDEIRGIMCTRNHMSGRDGQLHEVVEFSFLRLRRAGEYLLPLSALLLVLQGYLRVYAVTAGTIDTQAALVRWAVEPKKVTPQSLEIFCENIRQGLGALGSGHDTEWCIAALRCALEVQQERLPD